MAKIENLDRLNKKLAKLAKIPPEARLIIGKALEEGGEDIAGSARNFVPEVSGKLKKSIKVVKGAYKPDNANVRGLSVGDGAGDPDLTVRVVAGDKDAWYARLVEFGTKPHKAGGKFEGAQHPGATAEPFFFPAYRLHKKRIKAKVSRATKKAVQSIVK